MSAMLESATKPRIQEDKILRFLVEGTVSETGSEFFRALARNLSEALQTYGAWVTEYLPETRRLRALAFWLKDGFLDHFEHAIDGTPCQPVIETKSRAHFPERLLDFFPNDPDLAAIGAVSYMGTPLLDTDGTLLGHLAVLDNRPMPAEPQLYELFDLFAARAVAELRRLRAESATREREAQLWRTFLTPPMRGNMLPGLPAIGCRGGSSFSKVASRLFPSRQGVEKLMPTKPTTT